MSELQSQFSEDSLNLDRKVKRSEVKEIKKLGSLDSETLKVTINTKNKLKTFLNTEYRWANENYMKPLKVSDMQKALHVTVDNKFGPGNFQALIQFQKDNGLTTDGLCGPKTQAILFGDVVETPIQVVEKTVSKKKRSIAQQEIPIKKAKVLHNSGKKRSIMDSFNRVAIEIGHSQGDIEKHHGLEKYKSNLLTNDSLNIETMISGAAKQLGVSKKIIEAIVDIESKGNFSATRFEEHKYYKYKRKGYSFDKSKMLATSYGAFQIMGFNFEEVGYKTVEDFVQAMEKSPNNQINAFILFVKGSDKLHNAMKGDKPDFTTIAMLYNGPKYHNNKYDEKLKKSFNG